MQFTAVYIPVPEGYIGFVEELPGANTQGATLEEVAKTSGKLCNWCWKRIGNWRSVRSPGRRMGMREPFDFAAS